jgi:hypothetical protein
MIGMGARRHIEHFMGFRVIQVLTKEVLHVRWMCRVQQVIVLMCQGMKSIFPMPTRTHN